MNILRKSKSGGMLLLVGDGRGNGKLWEFVLVGNQKDEPDILAIEHVDRLGNRLGTYQVDASLSPTELIPLIRG